MNELRKNGLKISDTTCKMESRRLQSLYLLLIYQIQSVVHLTWQLSLQIWLGDEDPILSIIWSTTNKRI